MADFFSSKRKMTQEIENLEKAYPYYLNKGDFEKADLIKKQINFLEEKWDDLDLVKGGWLKKSITGTLTKEDHNKLNKFG